MRFLYLIFVVPFQMMLSFAGFSKGVGPWRPWSSNGLDMYPDRYSPAQWADPGSQLSFTHSSIHHPSTHRSIHLSIHLFSHSHYPSIHPFTYCSICPFIHSPIHPSIDFQSQVCVWMRVCVCVCAFRCCGECSGCCVCVHLSPVRILATIKATSPHRHTADRAAVSGQSQRGTDGLT